ncbi:MAG: GDSL-type esterase/lipase family protein [Chitinophagaceae bacterium]
MKRFLFAWILALFCFGTAIAQNAKPFYNEITAFKKEDSLQAPPQNAILFVGSSSIRMWKDVQKDFPKQTIINRGFGGSSLPHVIDYAGDIILPYKAKKIVVYAGENDFTAADTVSAQTVAGRFQQLFYLIREAQPDVPIVFISIKPSPSRAHLMGKMSEANELIKEFLKEQKKTDFVDVYNLMLDDSGRPRADIFLEDNLHMNRKGYDIWKKALKKHLK